MTKWTTTEKIIAVLAVILAGLMLAIDPAAFRATKPVSVLPSIRKTERTQRHHATFTPSKRGANMGQQTYTSGSGTWTVPTGVTAVEILLIGGGGSGEGAGGQGGGGGGGSIARTAHLVTPGEGIAYSVGTGGSGGLAGGDTTFDGLTAGGGAAASGGTDGFGGSGDFTGGNGGNATGGSVGAGGGGSAGRSSNGNNGSNSGTSNAGGAAVSEGGAGGDGDTGAGDPESGAYPGGGGGGSSTMVSGGDGAAGYIQIDWVDGPPDAFFHFRNARNRMMADSMITLRQSTASQEIPLGQFVDATDGFTPETGLTIANTDIHIWKSGATSYVDKNSGGATHMADGFYYAVLDATDTNTIGPMQIYCNPTGAAPIWLHLDVLDEAVYDVKYGTTAPSTLAANPAVNVTQWSGSAVATPSVSGVPEVDVTHWLGSVPNSMNSGYVQVDLATIKTQAVTCANPPTILASVGTAATSTAQTGDSYAIVNSGTHGNAALKTLIDAVDDYVDTEMAAVLAAVDTEVGAIKAKTDQLTFTVANRVDATISTADATTVKYGAAFTSTAGNEIRISAWLERSGVVVELPSGSCTVAFREHGAGSDLFSVTDAAPNAQGVFELTQATPGFTSDRLYIASVSITDDAAVTYTSRQATPVR